MFQNWQHDPASNGLVVPDINNTTFQMAQMFLRRLVNDVQIDHRLVLRIADDPVEAPKETSTRWLKPWTQLQLTEAEERTFPHGTEIFLGTKDVKIAASSVAKILAERENAIQILSQNQARGIRASFTKQS